MPYGVCLARAKSLRGLWLFVLLTRTHPTVSLCSQMMGVLAKRVFPRAWNHPPATPATAAGGTGGAAPSGQAAGDGASSAPSPPPARRGVYHVSIAQCYDKKLEASRKDFRHHDLGDESEVDLVLTTAEVLELIEEAASSSPSAAAGPGADADAAGDFFRRHSNPPADLEEPLAPGFPVGQAAVATATASADGLALFGGVDGEGAAGGGSGGYLEHVFRHAAREIFGVDLAGRPLEYREGRNPDFRETSLEVRKRRKEGRKEGRRERRVWSGAGGRQIGRGLSPVSLCALLYFIARIP